jgi:hypothetical protein
MSGKRRIHSKQLKFSKLKRFYRVATHYDKTASAFLGKVNVDRT